MASVSQSGCFAGLVRRWTGSSDAERLAAVGEKRDLGKRIFLP